MKLRRNSKRNERESTIPLINVVFLMLIFFLIAGTISPVTDNAIEPILTSMEKPVPPEEAISIRQDGTLMFKNEIVRISVDIPKAFSQMERLIVYPDKETDALLFLDIAQELHHRTKKTVVMLVERAN